jgi:hypothetical protein
MQGNMNNRQRGARLDAAAMTCAAALTLLSAAEAKAVASVIAAELFAPGAPAVIPHLNLKIAKESSPISQSTQNPSRTQTDYVACKGYRKCRELNYGKPSFLVDGPRQTRGGQRLYLVHTQWL